MVKVQETSDKSLNDDQPSNTLELFTEVDDVLKLIDELKFAHCSGFERAYEKYSEILGRYQEQPHLLDPHINKLIDALLVNIRNSESPPTLFHASFKYLYQICKVRTYKVLVKFLPHELTDLELVLNALEKQKLDDSLNWETRYVLLLWMSIAVLNPFHMSRLDAFSRSEGDTNNVGEITKMERIYRICQNNCLVNDTCSMVAAFLCAKYLIRIDIKDEYLPKFFYWVGEHHKSDTFDAKFGQLAAIAAILKHGKREDLIDHAKNLLKWILACDYKNTNDFLKNKYYIKIVQRLGLVFLKPRLANWRYQRGSRSLTRNLGSADPNNEIIQTQNDGMTRRELAETDEEIDVPEEIEEILEELLQGLRSASSDIRWLAAKGIGRVTNRLPKIFGDEVVGSVIEILNPIEPHEAWHGACLAIAELAKRGLLLPYRLTAMVPLLLQALVYDEIKGYMSVGQHIRDSACYMSWAFARAYNPSDLQPFVQRIAAGLIVTTVFDREINCRRAASAAFQENVGRLGNFPHGIDILTAADFYSVGLRSNSYLEISDFVAQYEDYINPLIDHLIEKKINHWDTTIRELSAKTLYKLTKRTPKYLAENILPTLLLMTSSIDINARHGSVLAVGEIILSLSVIEKENICSGKYLNLDIILEGSELIEKFIQRDQFRGYSGEIMKQCCCDFIRNVSKAQIAVTKDCIDCWQTIIDKCIVNKTDEIREGSISALTCLCESYYNNPEHNESNLNILEKYLKGCNNDLEEHIRMGYISAIGALPKFMLKLRLNDILKTLIRQSLLPNATMSEQRTTENPITNNWSEARRDSVKALGNVIQTIGFDKNDELLMNSDIDEIFDCFLKALDEYTLDNRGDIGAWVREASMNALYALVTLCPKDHLQPEIIHKILSGFAQQSVEKIDRTRGLAGKLFCNLIHYSPEIPYIQRHNELKNIFPADSSKVLWLFADHTFPMFCSMLEFPEYSKKLILGLSASIGQLTESLIKYSSASMFHYLKSHPQDISRLADEIVYVFQQNILNERVTYPMLNFLDLILSSGTLNSQLNDENSKFPDEIFRLVNAEIKGHKKLYKLVSSINVFCQLIQVSRLCPKVLTKMSIFLGLTHVHIRKSTALKLYDAMTLYGDTIPSIPEGNLDEILMLLSETDWGMPLAEIRPIRNELCKLMGIKAPVTLSSAPQLND